MQKEQNTTNVTNETIQNAGRHASTKRHAKTEQTRKMIVTAMLSAIAVVLMLFDFPLPFLPSFYKIDISEFPVLIGAFAMGPLYGLVIETVKVLLNLCINGTVSAGVGELANFFIGCAFVLPASFIYTRKKTKKSAVLGMCAGIVTCVVTGCLFNAYLLLPAYAKAFHMPIEGLIAMGTKVNASINGMMSFVVLAVAPFNFIKCFAVSLMAFFSYKPLKSILLGRK